MAKRRAFAIAVGGLLLMGGICTVASAEAPSVDAAVTVEPQRVQIVRQRGIKGTRMRFEAKAVLPDAWDVAAVCWHAPISELTGPDGIDLLDEIEDQTPWEKWPFWLAVPAESEQEHRVVGMAQMAKDPPERIGRLRGTVAVFTGARRWTRHMPVEVGRRLDLDEDRRITIVHVAQEEGHARQADRRRPAVPILRVRYVYQSHHKDGHGPNNAWRPGLPYFEAVHVQDDEGAWETDPQLPSSLTWYSGPETPGERVYEVYNEFRFPFDADREPVQLRLKLVVADELRTVEFTWENLELER